VVESDYSMQNKLKNAVVWLALIWAPMSGQTRIDLGRQGKSINFSEAGVTKPFQTGTVLPAVCTTGETFFKSDGSPNKSLYTCAQDGTWAQVGDEGIPTPGGANRVLSTDGTSADWRTMGGDVYGPPQALQVQGIQGRMIAPNAPQGGQVLSWNSSGNRWEPGTPAPAVQANAEVPFSGQSSVTTSGAAHGLNSANLISQCYLGDTPLMAVSGYQLSVNPSNYDATITFPTAFTGTCILNAFGGGTAGEGGGADLGTLTGVIKATSGIPSVVAGGANDCVFVNGTSGACAAGTSITAGAGINVAGSVVSVDTSVVPTLLAASATLDFSNIPGNTCATQTISFAGAATGDSVIGSWPADLSAGIIPRILISSTNTAQIQLCNVTTGAIDPPARTYGAAIVRSF
jgi:hypothetical protein